MSRPSSPATILRRALDPIPEQAFITRADLVAFGATLVELLQGKKEMHTSDYASLSALMVDYKISRANLAKILSTHLVRKLALPTGGLRYHREDVRQYMTANFSAHSSAPDHS